jgi:hypothetical protein
LSILLGIAFVSGTAQAAGTEDGIRGGEWSGSLHGHVLIGDRRYAVDGKAFFAHSRMVRLELSVALETGHARASVAIRPEGGNTITFAGREYPMPRDQLVDWGKELTKTMAEVESSGKYTRSAEDNEVSWESRSFVHLGTCFPAKVRYVYRVGQEGLLPSGPCRLAVYSLAEWNNPFHETVVLELLLRGPEQGAER